MKEPMWLTLARKELGVKEVPGDGDNPVIAQYWKDAGMYDKAMGQDEVPWCKAFLDAMLMRSNIQTNQSPLARSALKWGIGLRSPVLGCVCVYKRGTWQGHVQFYLGTDKVKRHIVGIGGNQGDAVTIAPFKLDDLMEYRWPRGMAILPEWIGPFSVDSNGQEVSDR